MIRNELLYYIRYWQSAEDGIRTHVPKRTNGFQDRLVMTASIPLRILVVSVCSFVFLLANARKIIPNIPPCVKQNYRQIPDFFFASFGKCAFHRINVSSRLSVIRENIRPAVPQRQQSLRGWSPPALRLSSRMISPYIERSLRGVATSAVRIPIDLRAGG